MATPQPRQSSTVILLIIVVLGLALLIGFLVKPKQSTLKVAPTSTFTPAIPASSQSAKEYIDRASKAADRNDYAQASAILKEAIVKFPDDANLKLTLEYYENQAQQTTR